MENMQNQKTSEPLNKNLALVCGTIILVCLIISAAYLYSRPNASNSANNVPSQQQPIQTAVDISKVKIDGSPFIGNNNAPVVIAFWSDYQCPFCKKAEQEVVNQIYDDYVKAGKVKIVYKDYAFLGADSVTAGWAARAVWEVAPNKFYAWNKAMFEKQDDENSGWGNKAVDNN